MIPAVPLRFRLESRPDALILYLVGDAGHAGTCELASAAKAVAARDPDLFLIDASRLDYIGSAGVGVLMSLRAELHAHGGRVAIVGAPPEIARLHHVLRLDRVIPLYASMREALAAECRHAGAGAA